MISPPVSIVIPCFTYVKQMFHHGSKLLSALCFTTVTHVCLWITCVTWRFTCDNPFVSLGLQLFSGGSCVLPVWHTYSSVFAWNTEVIAAVILWFGLVKFLWGPMKFLWKSCGILVWLLWNPCEILWKSCVCSRIAVGYYRPPVTIRNRVWNPRIDHGGCPRTLAPQRFPNITSDNHTLSEQITCSLLKTRVSICARPVDYIAITYV